MLIALEMKAEKGQAAYCQTALGWFGNESEQGLENASSKKR
jgi:hypothetical protein